MATTLPLPEDQSEIQLGKRESGNKGKESHFLLRGRKEVEIQPATQPSFRLQLRAGEGWLTQRASKDGGSPPLCTLSSQTLWDHL